MQLQKEKRKFEKWIKIKQIDIKKSRKKSKENEIEELIWKCKGLCTIFRRKERKEKKISATHQKSDEHTHLI